MALGTMTYVTGWVDGNKKVRVFDVQLSSGANYTTGGETISVLAARMGKRIELVHGAMATTTSGTTSRTCVPLYQTNGSVKLTVQTTASAEAANNSDQSTFTARLKFIGI